MTVLCQCGETFRAAQRLSPCPGCAALPCPDHLRGGCPSPGGCALSHPTPLDEDAAPAAPARTPGAPARTPGAPGPAATVADAQALVDGLALPPPAAARPGPQPGPPAPLDPSAHLLLSTLVGLLRGGAGPPGPGGTPAAAAGPAPPLAPAAPGPAAADPLVKGDPGGGESRTAAVTPAPGSPEPGGTPPGEENECVVCMDRAREVTFYPCGHHVTCHACAEGLVADRGLCCMCCGPIERCADADGYLERPDGPGRGARGGRGRG